MLVCIGLDPSLARLLGECLGYDVRQVASTAQAVPLRPQVVIYKGPLAARAVATLRTALGCQVLVVVEEVRLRERRAVMAAGAAGYLAEGEREVLLAALEATLRVSAEASSRARRRAGLH